MNTYYTIAVETSELEQGGHHRHFVVAREGAYNTGDYPPLFRTFEAATAYLILHGPCGQEARVVALELPV